MVYVVMAMQTGRNRQVRNLRHEQTGRTYVTCSVHPYAAHIGYQIGSKERRGRRKVTH